MLNLECSCLYVPPRTCIIIGMPKYMVFHAALVLGTADFSQSLHQRCFPTEIPACETIMRFNGFL